MMIAPWAEAQEVRTVKSLSEFNKLVDSMANGMETQMQVKFAGKLAGKEFRKVLTQSRFFNHSRKYRYKELGNATYLVEFELMDSARMLAAFRNPKLESKLTEDERLALIEAKKYVKRCAKADMNRLQKVKALHDDLVKRVYYDRESGPECTTMLLQGKGVCDAYSRCLYLMYHMIGIPCHIVVGEAKEPHAWNLVQLDNKAWFHVDATWNDPSKSPSSKEVRHRYFCMSDKEIRQDHKWDLKQYPATPKEEGAYYRAAGLYFGNYKAFWKAAEKSYERGDDTFDAYLSCYRSKDKFLSSMEAYRDGGGTAIVSSMAPPPGKTKGPVSLCFYHKNGKTPPPEVVTEEDTSNLPVEKNPSWMDADIWKDLSEAFDMDEAVRAGSRLLLKGIDAAQEAAEHVEKNSGDWKAKGMEAYDGLKKLWNADE